VVDPGQGLSVFEGEELIELLDGAAVYVVNDYEWSMTLEKTGLDEDAIAARVGALIVTKGAKGSIVRRGGRALGVALDADRTEVPSVEPEAVVDPTGCGDAYRSGVLYGLAQGWPLEKGAKLGSLMGSLKVAHSGPQSIAIGREVIAARFEEAFGEKL
jgi:adenosine kinase